MNTLRSRLYQLSLVACAVFVTDIAESVFAIEPESIVLPNHKIFGKRISSVSPLVVPKGNIKSVYPESIHLDLHGPIVWGVMATYPETIEFKDLVEAVNTQHQKWWRDKDGQMAKFGVTTWRNEDARFVIQVADSQVIMIWLDRKITDREATGTAMQIFRRLLEEAQTDSSHGKP